MSKFLKAFAAAVLIASPVLAEGDFGLGRAALPEEIAAWDLDVQPDGTGLPAGSGDVLWGEEIFAEQCAACHGDFAEGVGNWPKLAGGADTLADKDPLKTVGSFWPYLSTTWDYVNRSMPFGNAQTLTDDEVYAMVAYILYSNDLVDEDFVLSDETFLDVEMPNVDGFFIDDRIEAEHAMWVGEPCMQNCKADVTITMRARVLDVTPQESAAPAEPAVAVDVPAEEKDVAATNDPALIAAGEKVFKKCRACHQVGETAGNRAGPALNGILGRVAGQVEGFKYSKPMRESGIVWDEAAMSEFLQKPKAFLKGTRMSFSGLKKPQDRAAIIAYLSTFE